ncbi:hypothetical protein ACFWY6_23500 [Streptomyces sp. NPDC059037]|uniref:hypothetical protein n=1 Tax=Streptomyces sp. NPDC059037 TaxID=3346710 RepID=UPI0036CEC724
MSYRTTISYGTWCNRVNNFESNPDYSVDAYITNADPAWLELLDNSGALEKIRIEYVQAINAALPPSISLSGDEFIGPWQPEEGEFDGYPTDESDGLDFAAMVEDIDLAAIVERNEPLTLDDIGRWELKSKAKSPAKTASGVMAKLGLKPFTYVACGDSKRPQAIYLAGEVRAALAARPGRGTRSDLAAE